MGKALLDFIPAFPVLWETERKCVTKGRFSRGEVSAKVVWSKGFATCLAAVGANKHFLDAIPRDTRLRYKIFVFNLNEQMRENVVRICRPFRSSRGLLKVDSIVS